MPVGGPRPWKTIILEPDQTHRDSVPVRLPDLRAITRFRIAMLAVPVNQADAIAQIKSSLKPGPLPVISVHIPEEHLSRPVIDPAAETEMLKMLKACGFTILDAKFGKRADYAIEGEAFTMGKWLRRCEPDPGRQTLVCSRPKSPLHLLPHTMNRTFVWALCLSLTTLGSRAQDPYDDSKPWHDQIQPRFAKADLGRVWSGTVDLKGSGRPPTLKGLAIRVGEELAPGRSGTVLYDTELLRASAAIPDRFVMFNTWRDGLGGAGHWMGPPYGFTTRREPGWRAAPAGFSDPRPTPHGPLPHEQAHYKGLYRHGTRSVLAYSVGTAEVLESPWMEIAGPVQMVTRTIEITGLATDTAVKLLDHPNVKPGTETIVEDRRRWMILEEGDKASVVGLVQHDSAPVTLAVEAPGRVVAVVRQHEHTVRFKVLLWSGPKSDMPTCVALITSSPKPDPLASLTRPGPAQWTEEVVTQGSLGRGQGPYVVDTLTPPFRNPYGALMMFGGHDFFSDGDAALCTIHGEVWRVSGIDESLEQLTWHRYATGLFQPLGLRIVDDQVYVLGRDQITRLHDVNGDHETDYYENFNNDCKIGDNIHEYATSLETDPEGNFYYCKGSNGGQTEHDGSLIRVSRDGSRLESFATGFRFPNGAGAGPYGTLTVADQQGEWVPASRLDVVQRGGFYGYMPAHHRDAAPKTHDGPLCWIPHAVDNSCGGQTWVQGNRWGLPEGRMLHLSYGACRLFLVLEEKVDDIHQGGLVPLGVTFDSGAMRARFRPQDGQLYVTGLKGWQTSGARDGCFQRVRFTGRPLHLPIGLHAHRNGVRLVFAEPKDESLLGDVESWAVARWNYRWTQQYGSKDYRVINPAKEGHDDMEVKRAVALDGGRAVFLELEDMQPVMQMQIQYSLGVVEGQRLRGAVHHTVHALGPVW